MFDYELEELQIISNRIKDKNYNMKELILAMDYTSSIVSKLIAAKIELDKEGELKEVIRD